MTISTEMWYTGYDPYTLQPVRSAKTQQEKLAQRMFFFWYKPEERPKIERELRRIGLERLIPQLLGRIHPHSPVGNEKHQHQGKPRDRQAKPGNVRRRHRGDR